MLPLDAVDGDVARLPYYVQLVRIIPQPLQQVQTAPMAQGTQRFGGLVPAHGILVLVLQHIAQRIYGRVVARLAKAVCQLVLQQRRRRSEGGSDGFYGGHGLLGRRLEGGEVLEREKGAEATSERLLFGGQDATEGVDLGVVPRQVRGGHGGVGWVCE